MREIVLDTETTGLRPEDGHRIIEIGLVELNNRRLTGRTFHTYINPKRAIDAGALAVHGITTEFLADKPSFDMIFSDLMAFIEDSALVIHNAPFDLGFLNHEFKRIKHPKLLAEQCIVVDTLKIARDKYPGQKNNLDALCKRLKVDNTDRKLHGALLDAKILAYVYLAMTGGQSGFFEQDDSSVEQVQQNESRKPRTARKASLVLRATREEVDAHLAFMERITGE